MQAQNQKSGYKSDWTVERHEEKTNRNIMFKFALVHSKWLGQILEVQMILFH